MSDSHSRKSSRERQPTEKMAALQAEEELKRERKFFKDYGALKTIVKEAREAIKKERKEELIKRHMKALEAGEGELMKIFGDLRKHKAPKKEVRERMDRASAMVRDSINALEEVLGSLGGPFDTEDRNQIARELLKQDYSKSVFSSSLSDKDSDVGVRIDDPHPVSSLKSPSQPPSVKYPESLPSVDEAATLSDNLSATPLPAGNHSMPSPLLDTQQFAQALADNMYRNRLPVPVPHTFSGNPLEFVEFERSFTTLIGDRIPPAEKLYYLKQYVTGQAKEAIEGFFYGSSEEAYAGAWQTLRQRYGHPFQVQRAFREKLNNWPKIAPRDAKALQRFADFLKSCMDAMPYVDGLEVLNDCLENQRLLGKLPDWLAATWNRKVTDAIENFGGYPKFKEFVRFMLKEAQIANNPISSLEALKVNESARKTESKVKDKVPSKKGSAMAVKSQEQRPKQTQVTDTSKRPPSRCSMCTSTEHHLEGCTQFKAKSLTDRRKFVMENAICFGCLRKGHFSKECRRRHKCEVCGKRHPSSLHEWRSGRNDADAPTQSPRQEGGVDQASTTSHKLHFGKSMSTSMIVPVWVSSEQSPSKEILTYALLDTQSDASFILEDVAQALGVQRQPLRLQLSTMTSSSTINCDAVPNLLVRGMTSPTRVKITKSYTRDFIPADREHIPTRDTADKWPHLQAVAREMSALQGCEVGLLIGYNCPRALVPRRVVTGTDAEPYAVQTDLGWSVIGTSNTDSSSIDSSRCGRVATRELPGITPKDALRALEADFNEKFCKDTAYSQEDIEFVNYLEANISQSEDGHLEMPLPFKKKPEMPNNRRLAAARLKHLQKKMERDERYKEHYKAFMTEVIDNGFAERAQDEGPQGSTNYIPHHGVYHPQKNKIRIVFDCSARFGGMCLNDHLLKGPDLTNALVGVLLRFRQHQVAIMCDIEKMFFQFTVEEGHRDFLRFLWWEDNDLRKNPVDYRMTVHLFGAASSPGCANYGLKYLAKQHRDDFPVASRFIERNIYVDDGITSLQSPDEAIQLAREATELCQRGGIRLHKFVSNTKAVVESIPESERSVGVTSLDLNFKEPMERALGIWWNTATDHFCFKISLKEQPSSRRGILSTVASLYDPLGFVAPVVLKGKRVLQEMCRNGIGWDDPIPATLQPAWEQWLEELPQVEELRIPRCQHPSGFGQQVVVQLHHFSDASTTGYGQCSYVRLVNAEGEAHCSLIFAKSRVAPSKVVTIPRLELTAAVVSAKVSSMLKDELEYTDVQEFYWTDSQVVLGYINNEARRFHTFVANRVQQIRERTSPEQWHYVPTDQNPADYASRGLSAGQLQDTRWFKGPEFLWEKDLKLEDVPTELKVGDPEVKMTTLAVETNPEPLDLLTRLARISDWSMMVKVVARLRMVAKGARRGSLVQERKDAETIILQLVQRETFSEEIQTLTHNTTVKNTSRIHNLCPFVDTGTLRVGGRLQSLSKDVANPVILPRHSPITLALVRHFHHKVQHQGRGITQNEIRANGYWIVNGSRVVAELVRNCLMCRRLRRPEEEQKMANLPRDRIEPTPPFSYVGMDCFGPIMVKRARSDIKRYGLLFTCFCSRAVHIEMLDDMSTDTFINALRCFIAIRGAVRQIRCDQGSNFVGARNEFKAALKEMDADRIAAYLADQQCEFVFNTPQSSHAGGVWERQIRTVRSVLRATVDVCPGRLTDSALRTFFYEAMAIVNGRPLTLTNLNDPSAEAPLTPNHLLTMKGTVPSPPPGQFHRTDLYTRKAWRRVQFLVEQFWSRWRKEYLLGLQERHKWARPRRNVQVGDVVLVVDQEVPRMKWPLAIVTNATQDEDGLVRKVRVRIGTRNLDKKGHPEKELSEYWRPVQKVILLLECSRPSDLQ